MATQEISKSSVFGYYIQDKKGEGSSRFISTGDPDGEGRSILCAPDVRVLASCNQGNLCVAVKLKGRDCRYYVGKPCTRQWKAIPNPKKDNGDEPKGIMVLQSTDDSLRYAIIRLTSKGAKEKRNARYRCEIFDSKFWIWRQHEDLIMSTSSEFIVHSPGVSYRNSVYWLTSEDNVVDLQFDQKKDDFKFEYIKTGAKKNTFMKLVEFDIRLLQAEYGCYVKLVYIILTEEGLMELWVMREEVAREYDCEEEDMKTLIQMVKMHEDMKTCRLMVTNFKDLKDGVKYPCHAENFEDLQEIYGKKQEDMETFSMMVTDLKNHKNQVKYPCHAGFCTVDNFEDLDEFQEIICYEKWTLSTNGLVKLNQLNGAVDVFQMLLDFKPIILHPGRPTLSDIAKKSKSLRRMKGNTRGQLTKKNNQHSFSCAASIFAFILLIAALILFP